MFRQTFAPLAKPRADMQPFEDSGYSNLENLPQWFQCMHSTVSKLQICASNLLEILICIRVFSVADR